MEYITFGRALERCRYYFLPAIYGARRVLSLGEGDGRFVTEFLQVNRTAHVEVVEESARMIQLTKERVRNIGLEKQLRAIAMDVRDFEPDAGEYDLVVTHFFLDCLQEDEIVDLLERLRPYLSADCQWLVSEFSAGRSVWRKSLIAGLYFVFRVSTHLQVRTLPEYARWLQRSGFELEKRQVFLGRLIYGELWKRRSSETNGDNTS